MTLEKSYDVAVIGLGVVGSSALRALSKLGYSTIGIDRFSPPHDRGSSHGESRITRQAIGEGEAYVPLALRSHAILEELEQEFGEEVLVRCGFLIIQADEASTMCHGKGDFIATSIKSAQAFGIEHELLNSAEIQSRFPQFIGLSGSERAYHEPGGGYVKPDAIVRSMIASARSRGASVLTQCRAHKIERDGDGFAIQTELGRINAQSVIVSAGPWVGELSPRIGARLVKVQRQILHWFPLLDRSAYRCGAQPTFYWMHGPSANDQFYGFPPIEGFIKVAIEQYGSSTNADNIDRSVTRDEQQTIARHHVFGRLAGTANMPSKSQTCLYSVTPDFDFVIGEETAGLHIVSACSGHGFKHAPAMGEAMALKAVGRDAPFNTEAFSASRFR